MRFVDMLFDFVIWLIQHNSIYIVHRVLLINYAILNLFGSNNNRTKLNRQSKTIGLNVCFRPLQ